MYRSLKSKGVVDVKGKYYGVYDFKRGDACLGAFESVDEICDFFGGITNSRVWCAVTRKHPLAFKTERYWVEVFKEPTEGSTRNLMRQKFGANMFKISPDGIFIRKNYVSGWRLFAADFEEATRLCG